MYSFLVNAAIKGEEAYEFFTYKGAKPVTVYYRGKPTQISKGDKFGVRQSINKRDIRLIFPGAPNRVHTLTLEQAQALADGVKKGRKK